MAGYVTISCPCCPRDLRVGPEHIGRRVACKFCGSAFRVPTHLPIPCPKCQHEGMVRSEYLGHKIRCKSCEHAFRARVKSPVGRTRSDVEVGRLLGEIDRRERQLADLTRQLDETRGELAAIDARAHELTESRDLSQMTEELSVIDDGPMAGEANGTQPDLPLADLDADGTRLLRSGEHEADVSRTRLARNDGELETLREERDLLREELDRLRETTDRTVITKGSTETLERDLAIAKADNSRLEAELAEANRTIEGLMRLLRERDIQIVELAGERDGARSAFELAESARLALVQEIGQFRSVQAEVDTSLSRLSS